MWKLDKNIFFEKIEDNKTIPMYPRVVMEITRNLLDVENTYLRKCCTHFLENRSSQLMPVCINEIQTETRRY
jgi:hypothetical protein